MATTKRPTKATKPTVAPTPKLAPKATPAAKEPSLLKYIDIDAIEIVPGLNPDGRTDLSDKDMKVLITSIKSEGVREALRVFDRGNGTYGVLGGHRRLTAVRAINESAKRKIEQLPCIVETASETADKLVAIVNGNTGIPLTPLMQGAVYAQLADQGLSHQEISKRCNVARSRVSQFLRIGKQPKAVLDLVAKGAINSDQILKHYKAIEEAQETAPKGKGVTISQVMKKAVEIAESREATKASNSDIKNAMVELGVIEGNTSALAERQERIREVNERIASLASACEGMDVFTLREAIHELHALANPPKEEEQEQEPSVIDEQPAPKAKAKAEEPAKPVAPKVKAVAKPKAAPKGKVEIDIVKLTAKPKPVANPQLVYAKASKVLGRRK